MTIDYNHCGYCNSTDGFDRSPQGRPYCRNCGAIPKRHQGTIDPSEGAEIGRIV